MENMMQKQITNLWDRNIISDYKNHLGTSTLPTMLFITLSMVLPLQLSLSRKRDAMAKHRFCQHLDVVGNDKITALKQRISLGGIEQGYGGTRRGPYVDGQLVRVACTIETI